MPLPEPRRRGRERGGVLGRAVAAVTPACVALGLAAGVSGPARLQAATIPPQEQIETRLMCYCGCTDLTVRACSCGTAAEIKQDIAQRLASGQTADEVVEAYVERYGRQIRSAPTTQGFDLVAWVMPFVAILAGAVLIVQLTRRWRGRAAPPAGAPAAPAFDPGRLSPEERKTLERIAREIREEL